MTLLDLVQKYTWPEIKPLFLQLHPRENICKRA